MAPARDFDLKALYHALDAQRAARGLSWAGAMREINRVPARGRVRPVSASTATRLLSGSVAEADGVLQMLAWLNRTPESFIPGHSGADAALLPAAAMGQILRVDTKQLHAALEAERRARGMTWKEVAGELKGIGASTLTGLARGGRTAFPAVTRMTGWLGQPLARFTRLALW